MGAISKRLILSVLTMTLVVSILCYSDSSAQDAILDPSPVDEFAFDKVRSPTGVKKPSIKSVGGKPKTQKPAMAHTFKHAIVDVKIDDFDTGWPPELRIFDEKEATKPISLIKFRPVPGQTTPQTLNVEVFLAYDSTPWDRTDLEPEQRTTRIELHMPVLDNKQPIETVYAKLAKGTFVVPVVWHNIVESANLPYSHLANEKVFKFFCVSPTVPLTWPEMAKDVNTLWASAGIQFRLVNRNGVGLDRPWHLTSVLTHVVYPPDKSCVETSPTKTGWKENFNSTKAVDIYSLYSVDGVKGFGGAFSDGMVFVVAGAEDARLLAHELGHYLGHGKGINEKYPYNHPKAGQDVPFNNIMNASPGFLFEQWQIDKFKERIKEVMQQGKKNLYNEDK